MIPVIREDPRNGINALHRIRYHTDAFALGSLPSVPLFHTLSEPEKNRFAEGIAFGEPRDSTWSMAASSPRPWAMEGLLRIERQRALPLLCSGLSGRSALLRGQVAVRFAFERDDELWRS
jgi:hypothetical protein